MCDASQDNLSELSRFISGQGEYVFALQKALTAEKSLGPENGGAGELGKAVLLESFLRGYGLECLQRIDSSDSRVPDGIRPNLICRIPGVRQRTLWLFSHMDVVGPGDPSAWRSCPWQVVRKKDSLFGRGVEDNQQAIVSMLLLARGLSELSITPELGVGLVFVSDEECGSRHGLGHLLATRPEMFDPDDFYLVPDGGCPGADKIEIAEKGQLWLKVTVSGRQCHASTPEKGINALAVSSEIIVGLSAALPKAFPRRSELFSPPFSTFVPTKVESNVPAINILPGKSVFYLDCRLLPGLEADRVEKEISGISSAIAIRHGALAEVERVHYQQPTSVESDSRLVAMLREAISRVYGVKACVTGIGGATVAAFLRERGLPAVVWSCIKNTCHQPNECSDISATLRDAEVFACLAMNQVPTAKP